MNQMGGSETLNYLARQGVPVQDIRSPVGQQGFFGPGAQSDHPSCASAYGEDYVRVIAER